MLVQIWLHAGYDMTSTRKRILEHLPYLKNSGIKYQLIHRMNIRNFLFTVWPAIYGWSKADTIIVQKYYPRPRIFFNMLRWLMPRRLIYDQDDALFAIPDYLVPDAKKRKKLRREMIDLMCICHHIIAGNQYIANFARQFNSSVEVIPTTIDVDIFRPKNTHNSSENAKVIIGWIGKGPSHREYILKIIPVFQKLPMKEKLIIRFYGLLGDTSLYKALRCIRDIDIQLFDWIEPHKIPEEIEKFDIGLMPIEDDEFTKGKCPTKAMEYLACGVPVVASNADCVKEVVVHGLTGYLCSNLDDWVKYLSILIQYPEKRKEFGRYGRKLIKEKFSKEISGARLAAFIKKCANRLR